MRSAFRFSAVLLCLLVAYPCAVAKDVDARSAKRRLDNVFSKTGKRVDREVARLEGLTLTPDAGAEARGHALGLQRTPPDELPELDEVHQGAREFLYEVRTERTKYSNFAMVDLPPGLSADKPAPLVIALHSALGTAWRELSGLRACMRSARDHPLRECVIACPQALNRGNTAEDPRENPIGEREYFGWGPKREGVDTVFNLLDALIEQFNIDRDRIYLVGGANMGTEGAFHLAQLRPSQFAAICVRDGLPPRYYPELDDDADLEALRKDGKLAEQEVVFPWIECYRNTPIHWLHADSDKKFPTGHAHRARDAMVAAGVPVEFYEYEGPHASGSAALIAKALKACLGTERDPNPTTIIARGVKDEDETAGNGRNYWVQITGESYGDKGRVFQELAGSQVTVTADKTDNSLSIQSEGVREIIVYLHDDLLDLGREIKLVIDGKERTVNVKRELQVLARTAIDFKNTGEAYTARLVVRI